MKSATASIPDSIADAASDQRSVEGQARRRLAHARPDIGSIKADRPGVAAGAAQSQASSLADALEDTVRERPLFAVALALSLGFLIGAIGRR
ncbi:MAG TPA: DUF883 domain-containing protein [Roseiarcus sp.]